MPIVTFDSCIFIKHRPVEFPKGIRLSSVVLQEMTAGANDASELKLWEKTGKFFLAEGKLLIPNADDWWLAGKVLYSLQKKGRSRKTGKIPPLSPEETHRIIRDVLIARTAKASGSMLVTDNLRDFKKIKSYCDVKLISGTEYFS